jgi:CO/xanthine dehydrogenase FAD-binding subunit
MKPPPFEYYAPDSIEKALSLLAEHGYDAKPLAGGQSLIPTMNFRLARPEVLVDLNGIAELFYIREEAGVVRIGTMTRHAKVEHSDLIAQHAPLVCETMPEIAHPQIRNRGTFGGSMVHADPAAELPAVALALGASFTIRGASGERTVPAEDFFVSMFETAVQPGELLTEVTLPAMPERAGWSFKEVARRHGDYALVGAAALVILDTKGQCERVKLVYLGVGDRPVEASAAEALLMGQEPSAEAIRAAAESARSSIDPHSDLHASSDFRRHLIGVMAEQTLTQAAVRATEGKS